MFITANTPEKVAKIKQHLEARGFKQYATERKALNGIGRGETTEAFSIDPRGFVDYFCGDAMARAIYNWAKGC